VSERTLRRDNAKTVEIQRSPCKDANNKPLREQYELFIDPISYVPRLDNLSILRMAHIIHVFTGMVKGYKR